MRSRFLLPLSLLIVPLAGCSSPSPSSSPAAPATESVVMRPVTERGLPAAGFTVTDEAHVTLDCGGTSFDARPSAVAVDDDILACAPSSAFAVACWQDPDPGFVACYRDPWTTVIVRLPSGGSLPTATAPEQAQPLGLALSDGDRCLIRSGGVWNDLAEHPDWYGTYSCSDDGAVWAESADGIDRSDPRWTVQVAPISGEDPLSTREVVTAYYVGTAEG
ncbi:hypothetical protein [Cryobacterium sp. TMT3-29-2]|uniref:hypothetical protein n=1 Tax=Cryobacterium sp. TMT3-29-2 TaxID=2555867 RepID=UPI0010730538|nr:hypothetical protein [Cryobacterium sp. TMT3-29-2]TFC91952.1 hypothetical protein E3O67_04075 [Cryobacterium sp. TMT3-29-2]